MVREIDLLVAKYKGQAAAYGVRPDLRALYRYFARAHRRAGRRFPASRLYARIAVAYGSVTDVLRAVGVLFGERVLRAGRWMKHSKPRDALPRRPAWLDDYERLEGAAIAGERADSQRAASARLR